MFYARIGWAGDKPISLIAKHEEFAVITNGLSAQFMPVTDIADNKSILAAADKNYLQILLQQCYIKVPYRGYRTI